MLSCGGRVDIVASRLFLRQDNRPIFCVDSHLRVLSELSRLLALSMDTVQRSYVGKPTREPSVREISLQ
jgi:hypothetical protein